MGNWIKGAIKHPGALHEDLGVPQGQPIPTGKLAAAAEKGGKVGQRARLAETLKGFHRAKGGPVKAGGCPMAKGGPVKRGGPLWNNQPVKNVGG